MLNKYKNMLNDANDEISWLKAQIKYLESRKSELLCREEEFKKKLHRLEADNSALSFEISVARNKIETLKQYGILDYNGNFIER